jgi:putative aldouronate transport system substrate-binding protein
MKTRVVAIIVVLVFLVPAFSLMASSQQEGGTAAEKPVVTYHSWYVSGREQDTSSLWFSELEKRLDIKIELTSMINTDNLNKLSTMLASNELYDFMSMTRIYAAQYGPQGAFVDIQETFDTAPTLKRLFSIDANPWIYTTDKLYFMPGSPAPYTAWGWTYNKEVADELGIAPPKTLDDWLAAWRKVKAAKPDMVPVVGRMGQVLGIIAPIFDIGGFSSARKYNVENGELISPWDTDAYKAMLEFVNTLYSEGLLYQDFNTATGNDVQAFFTTGQAFTALEYSSRAFGPNGNPAYVAADAPVGPFGDSSHMWIGLSSYWGNSISVSAVKNGVVDEAAAIADFYFSPEGQELSHYGKSDETYIKNGDGTFEYTQYIKDLADQESDGNVNVQLMKQPYNLLLNGHVGWGVKESILNGLAGGTSQEQLRSIFYVGSKLAPVTPPYWLSDEEAERLSALEADIDTYRAEWMVKFIVGQEPLSKWDEYVAGLKKFGLEETMEIVNSGYAKYLKAAGKSKGFVPQADKNISTAGLAQYVGL